MNNYLLGARESDITDRFMVGKVVIGMVACGLIAIATLSAQTVEIPREKAPVVVVPVAPAKIVVAQPQVELKPKVQTIAYTTTSAPTTPTLSIEQMRRAGAQAGQRVREELHDIEEDEPPPKPAPVVAAKKPIAPPPTAVRLVEKPSRETENFPAPPPFSGQTAFVRLADGFDMPVGKPDAHGYYRARGYRAHGHMGEDWDGVGGGDTDLGDPVSVIADGVVVFARDCHQGWGNVIIVRHAYRDGLGGTRYIDSLYGHLDKIMVKRGQGLKRGQQIATIGNAHGLYDAHLHLEIRKNLEIGMSRAKFAEDSSNYLDPSQFITSHRHLQSSGASCRVAMNTFTYDSRIRWDKLKNYSGRRTGGGQSESAYALKKALSSQSSRRD